MVAYLIEKQCGKNAGWGEEDFQVFDKTTSDIYSARARTQIEPCFSPHRRERSRFPGSDRASPTPREDHQHHRSILHTQKQRKTQREKRKENRCLLLYRYDRPLTGFCTLFKPVLDRSDRCCPTRSPGHPPQLKTCVFPPDTPAILAIAPSKYAGWGQGSRAHTLLSVGMAWPTKHAHGVQLHDIVPQNPDFYFHPKP